jgi:tetratricopeptide (TPR) repeat protein
LREAGALFGRAVALAPALVEARVRLARVKTLQHDDDRAAALLDQVLAAQPAPRWRYMALLLLGGIRERAGRPDEAIRLYGEAIDARPDGQSAYLAMSHAMYAAGDRQTASKTLDRMFARALTPSADEPWWDYLFDWVDAQRFFQDLREEAQR